MDHLKGSKKRVIFLCHYKKNPLQLTAIGFSDDHESKDGYRTEANNSNLYLNILHQKKKSGSSNVA